MKIVISTGIYPPEIGGPSEYARQLFETLLIQNHDVIVSTYAGLKSLPTGLRHIAYCVQLFIDAWSADYIIALDTFSVALPAIVVSKILRRKIVIRVGGDFLWESYIDRTGEPILLSEFYSVPRKMTLKERIIFGITHIVFFLVDGVVFSTEWQREIMLAPYKIELKKTRIIENQYPSVEVKESVPAEPKVFLSPSRDRKIKNKKNLAEAFVKVKEKFPDIILDTKIVSHEVLLEKIQRAYAVVVTSLSEVSPNLILDSLEYNVPVILTRDTGISERLKDLAVFIDPLSSADIAHGMETLLDPTLYAAYKHRIMQNTYTHSWNQIAEEFIEVYNQI